FSRQQEKDTNSQLNTFEDRPQNIAIANVYRQDFLFPGYTAQASFHYNNDGPDVQDRKSTRLNSSHLVNSYAVFCLKKKNILSNFMPVAKKIPMLTSSFRLSSKYSGHFLKHERQPYLPTMKQ